MNTETQLHRQVHPNWVEKGDVSTQAFQFTSQTFTPTTKDDNKLSVANGEKLTGQQSFEEHVRNGLASFGVVSVLCSECDSVNLGYEEDNNPYNGHSLIDFSTCSTSAEIKKKAKILKSYA